MSAIGWIIGGVVAVGGGALLISKAANAAAPTTPATPPSGTVLVEPGQVWTANYVIAWSAGSDPRTQQDPQTAKTAVVLALSSLGLVPLDNRERDMVAFTAAKPTRLNLLNTNDLLIHVNSPLVASVVLHNVARAPVIAPGLNDQISLSGTNVPGFA